MKKIEEMSKAELVAYIATEEANLKLAKDRLNTVAVEDLNGKKSGSEIVEIDGKKFRVTTKVTAPSTSKSIDNAKFFKDMENNSDLEAIYNIAKENGDVEIKKPTQYLAQIAEMIDQETADSLRLRSRLKKSPTNQKVTLNQNETPLK